MTSSQKHREELLNALSEDAVRRGLVLFVGSGINGKAAPQWSELIKTLIPSVLAEVADCDDGIASASADKECRDKLVKWCSRSYDCYGAASLVKTLAGRRYHDMLREELYNTSGSSKKELGHYCETCGSRSQPPELHARFANLNAVAWLCAQPTVKAVVVNDNYSST